MRGIAWPPPRVMHRLHFRSSGPSELAQDMISLPVPARTQVHIRTHPQTAPYLTGQPIGPPSLSQFTDRVHALLTAAGAGSRVPGDSGTMSIFLV